MAKEKMNQIQQIKNNVESLEKEFHLENAKCISLNSYFAELKAGYDLSNEDKKNYTSLLKELDISDFRQKTRDLRLALKTTIAENIKWADCIIEELHRNLIKWKEGCGANHLIDNEEWCGSFRLNETFKHCERCNKQIEETEKTLKQWQELKQWLEER